MTVHEEELMGVPLWLLQEYLVECGGRATTPTLLEGDGWRAELTRLADRRVGSLAVGCVRLRLEADDPTLATLRARLAPKLLRGGG